MSVRPPRRLPVFAKIRRGKSRRRAGVKPASVAAAIALFAVLSAGGAAWWWLNLETPSPSASGEPASVTAATAEGTEAREREFFEWRGDAAGEVSRVAAGPRPAATGKNKEAAAPPKAVAEMAAPDVAPSPAAPEKPKAEFVGTLLLDELQGGKKEHAELRRKSLELAFESGQWDDYRALLARSLKAWLDPKFDPDDAGEAAEAFSNPLAKEALLRHAFLTRADREWAELLRTTPAFEPLARRLMDSPDALQAFTIAVLPEDSFTGAMKVWTEIYLEDPGSFTEWRELAIACALVFDKGLNERWDGREKPIDPFERYRFYRDNSKKGRLTGNIRSMRASELVWVVGSPVPEAELEWALKHVNFRQSNWGQAYGSIKYDMEKAVKGESKKPYDVYSFAEIKKKGGICVDQAFYSAHTARAHGIPAAIIGGDGSRGPHAWIAWMADERDWRFAGRLGGYPAGSSHHPQTGREISEDEIVRWNDRKAASPSRVEKAWQRLWLAEVYEGDSEKDVARQFALLEAALKAAPRLPAAASALLTHWTRHRADAPVEEWRRLAREMREDFRDHKPLMAQLAKAEEKCLFPRQDTRLAMRALRREAKKLDDTEGAERGVTASTTRLAENFRRQAALLKEQKDLNGVRFVYKRALAEYGGNPALFKALARDFFSLLRDDPELAARACFDLESACRREIGRGRGDWFDVTSQNSAWAVVADCYEKAGNARKAASIRKDIENRENAARRRAI